MKTWLLNYGELICIWIPRCKLYILISLLYIQRQWVVLVLVEDNPLQSHSQDRKIKGQQDNLLSPAAQWEGLYLSWHFSKCSRLRRWSQQRGRCEMFSWGVWCPSRCSQVQQPLEASPMILQPWASLWNYWQCVRSLGREKGSSKVSASVFKFRKCFNIDHWSIKWKGKNKHNKICIVKLNLCVWKRLASLQLFKNREFYSWMKMFKATREKIKTFYFFI